MNRFYRILKKESHKEGFFIIERTSYEFLLETKEFYELATTYNSHEDPEGIADDLRDALDALYGCSEKWDDRDPQYPENLYHWGFKRDGYIFVMGYTGIAGDYWCDEYNGYPLCQP